MRSKVESYLGFAKKSGNLMSGSNTCIFGMAKGKVRLVILADDISEKDVYKRQRYGSGIDMSVANIKIAFYGICGFTIEGYIFVLLSVSCHQ